MRRHPCMPPYACLCLKHLLLTGSYSWRSALSDVRWRVQSRVAHRSTAFALAGHHKQREDAAVVLQRWVRGYLARKVLAALRVSALANLAAAEADGPDAAPAAQQISKANLQAPLEAGARPSTTVQRTLAEQAREDERAARAALFAINQSVVPDQLAVAARRSMRMRVACRQADRAPARGPRCAQPAAVAAAMLRAARAAQKARTRGMQSQHAWSAVDDGASSLLLTLPGGGGEPDEDVLASTAYAADERSPAERQLRQQAWAYANVRFVSSDAPAERALPRVRPTYAQAPQPHLSPCAVLGEQHRHAAEACSAGVGMITGVGKHGQAWAPALVRPPRSAPQPAHLSSKPGSSYRRPRNSPASPDQGGPARALVSPWSHATPSARTGELFKSSHAIGHEAHTPIKIPHDPSQLAQQQQPEQQQQQQMLVFSRQAARLPCAPHPDQLRYSDTPPVDGLEAQYNGEQRAVTAHAQDRPAHQGVSTWDPASARPCHHAANASRLSPDSRAEHVAFIMMQTARGEELAELGACMRSLLGTQRAARTAASQPMSAKPQQAPGAEYIVCTVGMQRPASRCGRIATSTRDLDAVVSELDKMDSPSISAQWTNLGRQAVSRSLPELESSQPRRGEVFVSGQAYSGAKPVNGKPTLEGTSEAQELAGAQS
jgi:IQ calmodulin-binding motif